ncbi:hypothetical protein ACFHYQ_24905 [Sphaerimonospora cavernae]|uniref:HEAT repeat domain-containing protein n=1 Tax=Sphaerimonospora cavernae TaxID=1740611 RepID=A0ABV6UBJ5_9ACTN
MPRKADDAARLESIAGLAAKAAQGHSYTLDDLRQALFREAVRTLHRLNASLDFAAMLDDPAPVVVRHVVAALRDAPPPSDRLWALLDAAHPRHVRVAAHRLLSRRDTWSRIKASLILSTDADESLRRRARDDLTTWRAHDAPTAYHVTTEPMRTELNALITGAEATLGPQITNELRWLISSGR